nr:hypothetical protein [Salinibacterium sp. ZJ450]
MYQQVVVAAEQDALDDVGVTVIASPMSDVVRLGPRGGPVAGRVHAAAVAGGQGDPLLPAEQALLSSQVQHLPVVIEHDRDGALRAGDPLDRFDRHRKISALEPAVPGALLQRVGGHQHPHRRDPGTQDWLRRINGCADPQQLGDRIMHILLGTARIGGNPRRPRHVGCSRGDSALQRGAGIDHWNPAAQWNSVFPTLAHWEAA